MDINTELNRTMSTAIDRAVDLSVSAADREHFRDEEIALQKQEQDEAFAIDDKIDELTNQDIFDATDKIEEWRVCAQLCASSQATKDNYERLGRVIGQMVRDYAVRIMEQGK